MLNNYYQIRRDYYGELSDTGAEHGIGLYVVSSEGACAGHFVNNAVHGPGAKTWAQGERYVGAFENNRKHGYGHHEWSTGASYTGQFCNNQPDGLGILRTVHDLMFVGRVQGMTARPVTGKWYTLSGAEINPHSVGVDRWGDHYAGERVDGKRHGPATVTTRVGETETGVWDHGVRTGEFTFSEKNFVTTRRYDDQGIQTSVGERSVYAYGEAINTYQGHFFSGRYHGPGEYSRIDGYQTSGDWYFGDPAVAPLYTSSALQTSSLSAQRRLSRDYAPVYDTVIRHLTSVYGAERPLRILELGVGKGEHISLWQQILPGSDVVGIDLLTVDTNPATPLERVQVEDLKTALTSHPDVHTGVDCYDPVAVRRALMGQGKFDIIVHDATHTDTVWSQLDLYREYLTNAGCIITEEFACGSDPLDKDGLNHNQLMMAKRDGWRIWDTRTLHHYQMWNSLIGVWSVSDIDARPLGLYEV